MADIKAIETLYGGRFYRSRVEARWAVFFDCLAIRYSYEPEGLSLGSGGYLPDFWLPDLKFYLEIKGKDPSREECAKCAELAEGLGIDALLAVGPPEPRFQLYWFDRSGQRDDLYVLAQDRFVERGFWLVAEDHANWIGPATTADVGSGPMLSGAIEEAAATALSARFGQEWRRKSHRPIQHHPDRIAARWFAGDDEPSAAVFEALTGEQGRVIA